MNILENSRGIGHVGAPEEEDEPQEGAEGDPAGAKVESVVGGMDHL